MPGPEYRTGIGADELEGNGFDARQVDETDLVVSELLTRALKRRPKAGLPPGGEANSTRVTPAQVDKAVGRIRTAIDRSNKSA